MDRRRFIELGAAALTACVVLGVAGCGRTETVPMPANQEKLWNLASSPEAVKEPVDLTYVKNTPAFYRDASFGKEDPNFKPKTGGG